MYYTITIASILTFRRAIDNCVLLLRMLQDALRAEHVAVLHAIELDLFLRMLDAHLDLAFRHCRLRGGWVGRCRHGKTRQNLIVHRQVVWRDLMCAFVVRTLDYAVLGQLSDALGTEWMSAGERRGLFVVVIVRLETDAAFKDRIHFINQGKAN